MTKIAAIDHVLLLAAKNYNGQSMAQAAKKGASQGALDQAAKIFCDNVVEKARAEHKKMINGEHDKTTASFTLSKGADYLKELSQNGLSQEMKDYILREYLSVGILRDAQEVAEFGASPEALRELREALINGGEPRGLDDIAKLEGVPLRTWEVDALVKVCVKRHIEYNAHILVEAILLGASDEAREHVAQEFLKDRKVSRNSKTRGMGDWDVLLQILGDRESGPQEVLDHAVMMVIEDIQSAMKDRRLWVTRYSGKTVDVSIKEGVEFVKRGPSPHIADFFVQELVVNRLWNREDSFVVIHRCSPMLAERTTRLTLGEVKAIRKAIQSGDWYSQYDRTKLSVMLKKLARMARYVSNELSKAVIEELLENDLTDEAVALASHTKE